jgi:Zn-dependent protease with chaperone function
LEAVIAHELSHIYNCDFGALELFEFLTSRGEFFQVPSS